MLSSLDRRVALYVTDKLPHKSVRVTDWSRLVQHLNKVFTHCEVSTVNTHRQESAANKGNRFFIEKSAIINLRKVSFQFVRTARVL